MATAVLANVTAEALPQIITNESCNWEELCLSAIDHTWFGIGIEVLLLIISFVALAILCDERLVPSIECLCLRWLVPEDVAGCIFIALGSSAPEIIISSVATLRSKSVDSSDVELSIGAVIGSGAIAFLIIPAICTLFANPDDNSLRHDEKPVEVKRRPLLRDIGFYFIALSAVIVFLYDGKITLHESAVLVGLYFIYLIVVVVSPKIRFNYKLKNLKTKEEKQRLLLKRSISFVDLIKAQKDEQNLADKINSAHKQYSEKHPQAYAESPRAGANPDLALSLARCGTLTALTEVEEEDIKMPQLTTTNYGTMSIDDNNNNNNSDKTNAIPPHEGIIPKSTLSINTTTSNNNNNTKKLGFKTIQDIEKNLEPLRYHSIYNPLDPELKPEFKPILRQDVPTPLGQTPGAGLKKKFGPSPVQAKMESESSVTPTATGVTQQVNIPPPFVRKDSPVTLIHDEEEDDEEPLFTNPVLNAIATIISAPLSLLFEYTIPDARPRGPKEHLYPISFAISFLYLAFFSLVISAVFSRFTALSGIGGDFFGLVLVSSAAELPDLIQSITAAKNGYASMAMACLSSQIANILVGFGVPFLLSNILRGRPIYVPGAGKLIRSASIQMVNVFYFLIITLGFALWFKTNKVQMVRWKAHLSIAMYGLTMIAFAISAFAF